MKKYLPFVLCVSCIVFFAPVDVLAKDLGIAWIGKSGMTDRVMTGFTRGLKEIAPAITFNIEYQTELESAEKLEQVVRRFEKEKDAMLVLRSNGAKWLARNKTSIPTFIGGCNNPVELGAVKDLERPGGNITGVTYYIPASTHVEVFKSIQPDMNSIFLLMEKGHPGSMIDQKETQAVCAKLGIQYYGKMCESRDDLSETVKQNKDRVSAFILGAQALLMDNTAVVLAAAGNIPVYSYSEKPIKAGALAGYVADDVNLGYMLAESVIDVIVKGKDIKNIPVKRDPSPILYVNGTTYQRIGVKIPSKILSLTKIIE